jgi:LPXTG-motif cell wall-anchored protein
VTYIYKPTKKEPVEPEKPEQPEEPEEPGQKLPQTGEEQSHLSFIGATFLFIALLLILRTRKVRNK